MTPDEVLRGLRVVQENANEYPNGHMSNRVIARMTCDAANTIDRLMLEIKMLRQDQLISYRDSMLPLVSSLILEEKK